MCSEYKKAKATIGTSVALSQSRLDQYWQEQVDWLSQLSEEEAIAHFGYIDKIGKGPLGILEGLAETIEENPALALKYKKFIEELLETLRHMQKFSDLIHLTWLELNTRATNRLLEDKEESSDN